jgi:hypothetical protein
MPESLEEMPRDQSPRDDPGPELWPNSPWVVMYASGGFGNLLAAMQPRLHGAAGATLLVQTTTRGVETELI